MISVATLVLDEQGLRSRAIRHWTPTPAVSEVARHTADTRSDDGSHHQRLARRHWQTVYREPQSEQHLGSWVYRKARTLGISSGNIEIHLVL